MKALTVRNSSQENVMNPQESFFSVVWLINPKDNNNEY
jgi:hypothetical protein